MPGRILLSLLSCCTAVLLLFPSGGRAAAPGQAESAPGYGAPGVDPNDPWPEAEKKGLRPKSGKPVAPAPAAAATPTSAPAPAAANAPGGANVFPKVTVLNGIVIASSLEEFKPDGVPLQPGFTAPEHPLLQRPEFTQLLGWYLRQPLDESVMRSLQREIILYYRKNDRPLVDVLYPEQDVSNGMLQIIVIEARLKEVKVQNKRGEPYTNGWSGVKFLHNSIHVRTNEVITESQMLKDLDWLNRNPFRSVEAVYEPDKRDYGLTSVLLRADERRQWSADFGYEDSGSDITSEDRIIAGVTWGKALGLVDNQFRYAFTADPSFELLRVHSAGYYAPLPWRHGLRLSGYYLDVKGIVDENQTLEGVAYQASMRYEVPLPAIKRYQHEASIGLDFKYNENNLLFNQVSQVNTPTEIFQIAAGYSSLLPDNWGRTSFGLQGYYSPGGVTDLNSDSAFDAARKLAEAEYAYARFNIERLTRLAAGFSWIVRGLAQVATGNLLASEQLGMGGYATARGYDEREGNGDQGWFISNELRTPPFGLLGLLSKKFTWEENLQLLGFWDFGEVSNVDLLTGEDPRVRFSSVGVGLRYNLTRHLLLRFDYGWQLEDTGLNSPHDSRGHIGVVANY